MAKVPTAFEMGLGQVAVKPDSTPFQSFQTSPDQFGAGQGRALSTAGKGLMLLGQIANEISATSDKNAANRAMNEARNSLTEENLKGLYAMPTQDIFAKGAGPVDVYKKAEGVSSDVRKTIVDGLANDRQRNLFDTAWAKYSQTENKRASIYIASQFRKYTGEIAQQEKSSAEGALGDISSQIEQNYTNASNLEQWGQDQIDMRAETGLSATDAAKLRDSWPDQVAASTIRGWFSAQPNPLTASQELAVGKFKDKEIQSYWDQLDPKQRKQVSGDLIGRAQKLAQLGNDQRKASTDRRKEAAAKTVNDFFVNDKPSQGSSRVDIYENKIKNNPDIPQNVKKAARENLYGGPVVQDNEPGLVELEKAIRAGDIKTSAEAMAFRFGNEQVATAETMRTRIFPLVAAMGKTDFADAYNAGLADLGIVDTASVTSSVLTKRAATFRQSLLQWKITQAGKPGDPYNNDSWKAATAIAKTIKAEIKVDPAVMTMLKSLKARYNSALAAGNPIEAAAARKSMDGLMNQLGLSLEDVK